MMMQLKKISFATALLAAALLLPSAQRRGQSTTIFQNGKETVVKNETEITLLRENFSIRFYCKPYNSQRNEYYAAQIAAFNDKTEFAKVKTGLSTKDIACYSLGSGMAPDKSGVYEALIIDHQAHHFLFYENEKSRTTNLMARENGLLRLEFAVEKIRFDQKSVKLAKFPLDEIYLAIFIDLNLNSIIDPDELTKVTVKLQ